MGNKKILSTMILIINILIVAVYFCWRVLFTLPEINTPFAFSAGIIFLMAEMAGILLLWLRMFTIIRKKDKSNTDKTDNEEFNQSDYPDIDIIVLDTKHKKNQADNTVNACYLMDYPNKDKLHIKLIDGGMSELNKYMKDSSSPLIAVLEAGMYPKHQFAEEMVQAWLKEEDRHEIGFIQASEGAFNADSYQFRLFSQKLVPNKNKFLQKCYQPVFEMDNSVVYCGLGAVFSRKALDAVGGFDTECMEGYIATGIKIQKKGYKCKFVKKILLSGFFSTDIGECIDEVKEKVVDAIEAFKKEKLLTTKELSLRQKMNYMLYLTEYASPFRGMIMMLAPILFGLFNIHIFNGDVLLFALFWIAIYSTANLCLIKLSSRCITVKWINIRKISVAPFLIRPVLVSVFGQFDHKSIRKSQKNKLRKLGYFIPHIILASLSIAGIVKSGLLFAATKDIFYPLMIVWLFVNLYYELMSVFWLIGRPYVRQEDRIEIRINYELTDGIHVIHGTTRDFSSRGISIWCDKPYDINDEQIVNIKLDDGRYCADMVGNVIGVEAIGRRWKYVILFKNMDEARQQYYGLLYDRRPQETVIVSAAQNFFSDLNRNIGNRFKHKALTYRKMARIPVNQEVAMSDGSTVFVKNYNYKYLLIHTKNKPENHIVLTPVLDVKIECEKFHKFGEHTYMYKVMNYEELRCDSSIRNKIYEWVEQCSIENIIGMVSANLNMEEKDSDVVKYI